MREESIVLQAAAGAETRDLMTALRIYVQAKKHPISDDVDAKLWWPLVAIYTAGMIRGKREERRRRRKQRIHEMCMAIALEGRPGVKKGQYYVLDRFHGKLYAPADSEDAAVENYLNGRVAGTLE